MQLARVEFSRPVEVRPGAWVRFVDSGKPIKVLAGKSADSVTAWLEGNYLCLSNGMRAHLAGPLVECWFPA